MQITRLRILKIVLPFVIATMTDRALACPTCNVEPSFGFGVNRLLTKNKPPKQNVVAQANPFRILGGGAFGQQEIFANQMHFNRWAPLGGRGWPPWFNPIELPGFPVFPGRPFPPRVDPGFPILPIPGWPIVLPGFPVDPPGHPIVGPIHPAPINPIRPSPPHDWLPEDPVAPPLSTEHDVYWAAVEASCGSFAERDINSPDLSYGECLIRFRMKHGPAPKRPIVRNSGHSKGYDGVKPGPLFRPWKPQNTSARPDDTRPLIGVSIDTHNVHNLIPTTGSPVGILYPQGFIHKPGALKVGRLSDAI